MRPLLFLASLFLIIACGGPENKVESEDKVTPEDSTAGIVDTSAMVASGDTIDTDSIAVDSIAMKEDDAVKKEPTSSEMKEIPKHGSPDDEEIRKMKEEKNKKK